MLRLSRSRWVSLVSNLLLLAVVLLSWGYVLYAGKAGRHLDFSYFSTVFHQNVFPAKSFLPRIIKKYLLLSSFLEKHFTKCR
jgi:hypothetical protein